VAEVVNRKSVHFINIGGGGQVIVLKFATALILDRCIVFNQTIENRNQKIKYEKNYIDFIFF